MGRRIEQRAWEVVRSAPHFSGEALLGLAVGEWAHRRGFCGEVDVDVLIQHDGPRTSCALVSNEGDIIAMGSAKCSDEDKNVLIVGSIIALWRAMDYALRASRFGTRESVAAPARQQAGIQNAGPASGRSRSQNFLAGAVADGLDFDADAEVVLDFVGSEAGFLFYDIRIPDAVRLQPDSRSFFERIERGRVVSREPMPDLEHRHEHVELPPEWLDGPPAGWDAPRRRPDPRLAAARASMRHPATAGEVLDPAFGRSAPWDLAGEGDFEDFIFSEVGGNAGKDAALDRIAKKIAFHNPTAKPVKKGGRRQ